MPLIFRMERDEINIETYTTWFNIEVSSEAQRKFDPSRYQAAAEVTVCDNQDIPRVQPLLFVLSVIFMNLPT